MDKRYNQDGVREDVAIDFNTNLNSSVFPALGLVEQYFGMPAGSASIGRSVVSFEITVNQLVFNFAYGLTDRLTVGLNLPYYWQRNKVNASLNTLTANVGKNVALNTIAPLSVPGTVPLTTKDVQNLLGPGLDINGDGVIDVKGFGYTPVETWSDNDIGDLEVGFRYQYLKTANWRLAFAGGVRFPTGKVDDPDSLVDRRFGDGPYAFLFRLNNDFTGIKNLVVNFTFRYDLVLPDKEELRIPRTVSEPITINKEDVDRDLGDIFGLEASAAYTLLKGLNISLLYNHTFKLKDKISGNMGFAYESLQDETNAKSHIYIIYNRLMLFNPPLVYREEISRSPYRWDLL